MLDLSNMKYKILIIAMSFNTFINSYIQVIERESTAELLRQEACRRSSEQSWARWHESNLLSQSHQNDLELMLFQKLLDDPELRQNYLNNLARIERERRDKIELDRQIRWEQQEKTREKRLKKIQAKKEAKLFRIKSGKKSWRFWEWSEIDAIQSNNPMPNHTSEVSKSTFSNKKRGSFPRNLYNYLYKQEFRRNNRKI
jgi:hypothetical protein